MKSERNKPIYDTFAQRLTMLMNSRTPRVTQQDLADYIGVQRQAVTHYLRGVCVPRADAMGGIARYFGVTVDWLMGLDTQPPKEMTEEEAIDVLRTKSGLSEKACRALMSGAIDAPFLSVLIVDRDAVAAIKSIAKIKKRGS